MMLANLTKLFVIICLFLFGGMLFIMSRSVEADWKPDPIEQLRMQNHGNGFHISR